MPKKINVVDGAAKNEALEKAGDAANELVAIREEFNIKARSIAEQVGYDGDLSIGTLEDGIRFYQRRTVEACLELGKRLLVLKELTAHGEFEQRIDLLGFSVRSAQRFMQASAKTAKSANLAHLSTQVKSTGAFLELITLDDDVLTDLSHIEGLDRLSTSELKALVKNLRSENETNEDLLQRKEQKINQLTRDKRKVVALTDWPAAFEPLFDQAAAAGRAMEKAFSDLREITKTALQTTPEPGEEGTLETAFAAIATQLADIYATAFKRHEEDYLNFSRSLEAWVPPTATPNDG